MHPQIKEAEKIQNLDKYRNWLLKLTICDPACGSGAFLNQALSFLEMNINILTNYLPLIIEIQ